MEIKRLEREEYAGRKFTARYQTRGYYDICADEGGFSVKYTPFGKTDLTCTPTRMMTRSGTKCGWKWGKKLK